MVEITYIPSEFTVDIKGHAEYAEKGKDIVCSAVSCLFLTLAEALDKSKECLLQFEVNTEKGHIKAVPSALYKSTIQRTFFTIETGFSLLADNYPENVAFYKK